MCTHGGVVMVPITSRRRLAGLAGEVLNVGAHFLIDTT